MHKIFNKTARFIRSEDGPTSVEYAVMLGLIIAVCLVSIRTFGTAVSTSFSTSANSIGT
jgi:pilus assembly protein Flp/PilA